MRRRFAILVLSIIGCLIAVYSIVYCLSLTSEDIKEYAELTVQTYEQFGISSEVAKELGERVGDTFVSSSVTIYFIVFVSYFITMVFSAKKVIQNHKKIFIPLAVITLLLNLSLVSLATLILICTLKKDDNYTPKKIPKLQLELEKKPKLTGIGIILLYFVLEIGLTIILSGLFTNMSASVIELILSLSLLAIFLSFEKDYIVSQFKVFFSNFESYTRFLIPRIIILFILQIIASWVSIAITGNVTSANQSAIEEMNFPALFVAAVLCAPIVEEMTFRYGVRQIVSKNKYLFIIASGLLFASIHVIGEADLVTASVAALPYFVMGAGMAYLYSKSNNICCSMAYHFVNNLFVVLMTASSLIK